MASEDCEIWLSRTFKDRVVVSTALCLGRDLDELVEIGLEKLNKTMSIEAKAELLKVLEKRALPIILDILDTLNPKLRGNLRWIDEKMIWESFLHIRSDSMWHNVSIFVLFDDLVILGMEKPIH